MANYTTEQRVRNALGAIGSSNIRSQVIQEAIDQATSLCKSCLGKTLTDKIDTAQTGSTDVAKAESTASIIRTIATDMAAWLTITSQHSMDSSVDNNFTERYEKAQEWLQDIADGVKDIVEIDSQMTPESNTDGFQPAFQEDDPINHEIDGDRLETIDDNRD